MDLHLHNTLSRQKERFTPLDPSLVRMYVCGPTVYDFAHLGNARPFVVFDVLYRLLRRHFPRVIYARNITDVDDKIMERAVHNAEAIEMLTARTTRAFHEDMLALNTLPPDIEPRCTQHIPHMIKMIGTLIEKGHAYEAQGHVLFNVPSMATYGQLSRRSRDELIAGARVEVAPYKNDAADFVLWKPSSKKQIGWESPWGFGRPGWHIECSAMAAAHLGVTFDIHGGGLDLIFPHHENEIAQSVCAHAGAPLATYWLHNGFLTINNDKMSKSLKNFFTVRELLSLAPGEALRLALLSAHYRQPLDFSEEALLKAKATLDRWYGALRGSANTKGSVPVPAAVEMALQDDLNTPLAISHLHELVNELNRATTPDAQSDLRAQVRAAGEALGLLLQDAEAWFRWQAKENDGLTDQEIESLIAQRLAARTTKNYAESDRIRALLSEANVTLEDGPLGTQWRRS